MLDWLITNHTSRTVVSFIILDLTVGKNRHFISKCAAPAQAVDCSSWWCGDCCRPPAHGFTVISTGYICTKPGRTIWNLAPKSCLYLLKHAEESLDIRDIIYKVQTYLAYRIDGLHFAIPLMSLFRFHGLKVESRPTLLVPLVVNTMKLLNTVLSSDFWMCWAICQKTRNKRQSMYLTNP